MRGNSNKLNLSHLGGFEDVAPKKQIACGFA